MTVSFRAALVCLVAATPLACGAAETRERGILSIQVENDSLGSGTDRHYTNGLRLSYLTAPTPCPGDNGCGGGFMTRLANALPLFNPGEELRRSFSLGQNMYTPGNISATRLLPDDRPYAGWLYAGFGLVGKNSYASRPGRKYNRIDNLELNLGVIGPLSGASFVHKRWHDWFNFTTPRGWHNQLRNEPGAVLFYERIWQFMVRPDRDSELELDLSPSLGAAVGNVYTHAAAGLRLRVGANLPDGYGPPRIRPSLPGSDYFVPKADKYGVYAFAGVEGRAVARNIFLDGNTFRDSHSVDKKHWVGDMQLGAALVGPESGFLPPFRLSYTYILRSKEFVGQNRADRYGSINLSFYASF